MTHEQQDHDYLSLHDEEAMQVLFARHGDSQVLFSDNVQKMNKAGALQSRIVCITETTMYNLDSELRINWSQPLSALSLGVTVELDLGVCLVFEAMAENETSKGKMKRIKATVKSADFESLIFSCSSDARRKALVEVIIAHGSSRTDAFVTCGAHTGKALAALVHVRALCPCPFLTRKDTTLVVFRAKTATDIIPLMQDYPALASSPLAKWYERQAVDGLLDDAQV
jgi:hypothetical protein